MNRREFFLTPAGGVLAAPLSANQAAAGRTRLRIRQVHLDFRTSEHVEGIGAQFDPEEFMRTLKQASVNSITGLIPPPR